MVSDPNSNIQVLNISNVNAQGNTVLNDGKLLELIQKYPFLYNPRVRAYNDSDYISWAWKNINAAFNRSYANDPSAAFSTCDLMNRWEVLKPLIQCLSKSYDLEAIPQSLRQSVVKISIELEDSSCNNFSKPSHPQNLLLQKMYAINNLSKEDKFALEKEILNLILATELEGKQSTKLDEEAWMEVNQETDEFLNAIGFPQVLAMSLKRMNLRSHKKKKSFGWVPLKDAHKFIKPCYIKLNKLNVEDYLPLSKILKIEKVKNGDQEPGYSGIFGY